MDKSRGWADDGSSNGRIHRGWFGWSRKVQPKILVSRTTRFGEKPSNSNALEGSTKRYFFLSPSLNQESMFSFRGERFEYFKSFEFSNLSLETSIKRFRGDLWILVAKTYLECKIHLGVKLCWNLFSRMETFCRPEITLFKRFNATFAAFSCQSTAVLIKKI